MKSKKADIGIGALFLIVILVFFVGWLVEINQRECRTNKDCGLSSYCGSDFACHEFPVVQQNIVQYNFLLPSIILGIAILLAAWIYRRSQKSNGEMIAEEPKPAAKEHEEVEDINEPYYKSEGNIKTP